MRSLVFYAAVLAVVVGIALQTIWPISLPVLVWCAVLGGAIALLWWRRAPSVALGLVVVVGACMLGVLRMELVYQQERDRTVLAGVGETVTLTGVVVAEPDVRSRTTRLVVAVDDVRVVVSTDRYAAVVYGDVVTITGTLKLPETFATDLGREFNYPGYLRAQGITYQISFADVTVQRGGEGSLIISYLLRMKHAFMQLLEVVIPEPHVALGEGLLLGVKQALGEELETAFRKTGIIHIVVLSGYNVMLVVAFVTTILAFFFSLTTRTIIGVVSIVLFALLVGLSATVVRASIMAVLVLLAPVLGRQYNVLRALCFAGVVMLLINPYLLVYDVGFQLSFMATLGLIVVAPHFETMLMQAPSMLKVKEFMIATVATQIAVSPLLLYQIGELSIVSVVVNMLVLPMVAVAMLCTFVTGVVAAVSTTAAMVVAIPAYWSLQYIIVLAEWFAALPFAAVLVPAFPFWVVMVSYVGLSGVLWYVRRVSPEVALPVPIQDTTLIDWVIEDEAALRPLPTKNDCSQREQSVTTETPIFFR